VESNNLLEELRGYLTFAFWQLAGQPWKGEGTFDAREFTGAVRPVYQEACEILTHVFDFLYFYRRDSVKYVAGVWASWAVIPHIQHKIVEYITRCLCAVAVENIGSATVEDLTIDRLIFLLQEAAKEHPEALYIDEAIKELKDPAAREQYKQRLSERMHFVRFIDTFCYSPDVANALNREVADAMGDSSGIGVNVLPPERLHFDSGYIGNPIRFIEDYCKDKSRDGPRAAWVLNMLAFERPK
jgi:hypothetical protein